MTAIEFNNVGKQYRLGYVSTRTLSHDLNRWWQTEILHKEDPYLKIGETNDRSSKGHSDYVWALKDIDFKVEQGDVVGIIGKNGAGKSTLLKLLSKVTGPTTGIIKAKGRIGALLEVGTGFHSEMTGRENIYLNGAILGMTKPEITRKLDEIVDFSGCERYLDTPVKRYSSGMMVRLGFAVAAHLDPEILVVDEVLAVGDAEFQKKAIGKMKDVSKGEGRTVLFVSHNMDSIRNLCTAGILIENGMIKYIDDEINNVVDYYVQGNLKNLISFSKILNTNRDGFLSKELEIISAEILNDLSSLATDEPLLFNVIVCRKNSKIDECNFGIHIINQSDYTVGTSVSPIIKIPRKEYFKVIIKVYHHNLVKGRYKVDFNVGIKDFSSGVRDFDVVHNVLVFEITCAEKKTKKPYVFWEQQWGSHNLVDVEYTFV